MSVNISIPHKKHIAFGIPNNNIPAVQLNPFGIKLNYNLDEFALLQEKSYSSFCTFSSIWLRGQTANYHSAEAVSDYPM